MANDDLKTHALNPARDFYDLLGLEPTAQETEIRRAYRKTALKYHPDKVGASDTAALDKFHLLQIAYDVLSDAGVRELYDNARRAREEKKVREQAYEGRRKWMKEDLERRENGAVKRKREEGDEEVRFQRELDRIAEDGKRRRKEREELLRKEALEEAEDERKIREGESAPRTPNSNTESAGASDMDRSVTLRYPKSTSRLDREGLLKLWSQFGAIEDCVVREKRMKPPGEKHKKEYMTAVLVYQSIVGAHAAVSDHSKLQNSSEDPNWQSFEAVGWASGKEPDCIPKPATPVSQSKVDDTNREGNTAAPSTPQRNGNGAGLGLKKAPSFASFKGTPTSRPLGGVGSPSLDEITMIRLKNAERRRLEEKIRREEEAAATAEQ